MSGAQGFVFVDHYCSLETMAMKSILFMPLVNEKFSLTNFAFK